MEYKSYFQRGILMFIQIEYPSSVPLSDLEVSYKRQNKIIEYIKFLHTANSGVILENIETGNTDLPIIKAGSVCFFCETLFYTESDIVLVDENTNEGMRFIGMLYNINNKTITPQVDGIRQGEFKEHRGKAYFYDNGIIKMYLDFSMYYNDGKYYSKKYIKSEQA